MVKRKFDDVLATTDDQHKPKRQFLSLEVQSMDVDMDMSTDAQSSPTTAGTSADDSSPVQLATALPSNEPQASYPSFEIYPLPGMEVDGNIQQPPTSSFVGLLQPQSHAGGSQHGPQCTTIPKLRVSCSANMYGQRTMWAHCESCGAITLVE